MFLRVNDVLQSKALMQGVKAWTVACLSQTAKLLLISVLD